jgi:predicted DNA-binding transcriptional regulator AlpA
MEARRKSKGKARCRVMEEQINDGMQGRAERLLTIEQLSDFLQVPKSWIYERTRRSGTNNFPVIRCGRYLRFHAEKVLEWLKTDGG